MIPKDHLCVWVLWMKRRGEEEKTQRTEEEEKEKEEEVEGVTEEGRMWHEGLQKEYEEGK